MPFFKITEQFLKDNLSESEIIILQDYSDYLVDTRRIYKPTCMWVTLVDAYETAWATNFVDFKEQLPNFYNLNHTEIAWDFNQLVDAGMEQTAKLKWDMIFLKRIKYPTISKYWRRKK